MTVTRYMWYTGGRCSEGQLYMCASLFRTTYLPEASETFMQHRHLCLLCMHAMPCVATWTEPLSYHLLVCWLYKRAHNYAGHADTRAAGTH